MQKDSKNGIKNHNVSIEHSVAEFGQKQSSNLIIVKFIVIYSVDTFRRQANIASFVVETQNVQNWKFFL